MEVDLLRSEVFLRYRRRPELLRQEILRRLEKEDRLTVFIDEIQKAPDLLDEVHGLIESHKGRVTFVMTGSSARKLKRSSTNLLAGRAWEYRLFPLTHSELGDAFVLDDVLMRGALPPVWGLPADEGVMTLRAYANTYLKEEVLGEALTRNVSAFGRFLELAADHSGRIVSYSTLARETAVSSNTIKAYYQILEDTLVALRVDPFLKSARKRIVMHPKYYVFDLGVTNILVGRTEPGELSSRSLYGALFEQFIVLEVHRCLSYSSPGAKLFHWRSQQGAEVDLVVEKAGKLLAVEVKSSTEVSPSELRGLSAFLSDHPKAIPVVVCNTPNGYRLGDIPVVPWRELFGPDWLGVTKM